MKAFAIAVWHGVLLAGMAAQVASAQAPVRVLRYSPVDSGSPTSLITVTFSRPVTGMLGQSVEARRVMSIAPAVAGQYEWRDPVTLRFVPTEPFAPGTRYAVSVDTAAVATAGARTGSRYQFAVRIPGPRPLAQLIDGSGVYGSPIGPKPLFQILYSAPVNLDSVGQGARVVFEDSCGGTRLLRVLRQRPFEPSEYDRFSMQIGYARPDSITMRLRRIVDLEPVDSLPPGCAGVWSVNPVDPARPGDVARYRLTTYPRFAVRRVTPHRNCRAESSCNLESITVELTAPIAKENFAAFAKTSPALPHDPASVGLLLQFGGRLEPRRQYRVEVDSSVRDIFGRRLEGATSFTVTAPDRAPGIKQQSGLVTLARVGRAPASVTVRAMNVDTMIMHVIPIPDSLIPALLSTSNERRYFLLPQISPMLRDTFHIAVPVSGTFNAEGNVEVPIPDSIATSGKLLAIRFAIGARSIAPDSMEYYAQNAASIAAQRRNAARYERISQYNLPDLGMVAQISSWVVHTKVAGDRGAVFVTNRSGEPVQGATVSIYAGRAGMKFAGSTVTLHTSSTGVISTGVTDAEGLAALSPSTLVRPATSLLADNDPALTSLRYVVVRKGTERLIVPIVAPIATTMPDRVDAQTFGARSGRPIQVRGAILPDRNLYRPGETIFAKVFARAGVAGDATAPVGDSVRVALIFGRAYWNGLSYAAYSSIPFDTVGQWKTTLNRYGTALDSLTIPTSVRTGNHMLLAELFRDGTWQSIGQAHVRVEEFRAPEFLVTVRGDTAVKFIGDTIVAEIDARYLYGAPMSRAVVRWSIAGGAAYGPGRAIPGTSGFTIGGQSWWEDYARPEVLETGRTDSLDRNGHLTIRVPTKVGQLTRPSNITISAAIVDLNSQTVTARTSATLLASSLYVGARDRNTDWYWKSNVSQTIEAIAVTLDGERVAGVPIRATVIRRRYTTDTAGQTIGVRRWTADTVKRTTLVSGVQPVEFSFTPTADGAYDVRFEATDKEGRPVSTNLGRRAYVQPWFAANSRNPYALSVYTQRASSDRFSLGDVARVSFASPFPSADAWITIEREGVLEQRRMTVAQGTTTVPIPITDRFAPNVWVGVMLFKRTAEPVRGADSLAHLIRGGFTELRVDSTAHQLKVTVVPEKEIAAPGDSINIRVEVRDMSPRAIATANQTGKAAPAEVSLWAVDEGVLSMTAYRTPDLLNAIDQHLGVSQTLRTSLMTMPWLAPTGAVRPGVNVRTTQEGMMLAATAFSAAVADAGSGFPVEVQAQTIDVRSNFRFTAFYVGAVLTDSNGIARIRAKLPDNITTFRLMASAIGTGHRYGSGDAKQLVTRRVVLRSALPRFVRAGDSLMAASVLNVRSGFGPMRVSASVTGARLTTDSTRVISVSNDRGAVASFAVSIPTTAADVTRVKFTAIDAAAGDGDAFSVDLPVRPTGTPRAHTVIGMVRDTTTVTVSLPADIDPARSTVSFGLGTSPMVAMRSHYDRLRAYTYYGTDFIVAAARALLTMSKTQRVLGEPAITDDSVQVMADLQAAVNTLVQRQQPDGAFLYWPGSGLIIGSWFAADVGLFLQDARQAGLQVPEVAFSRLRENFTRTLRENRWNADTLEGSAADRRRSMQAFLSGKLILARYLRRTGFAERATEDSLLKRAELMTWEDRVGLIGLIAARSELAERAKTMLEQSWSGVSVAGRRVDLADSLRGSGPFPSHIRPAARLLITTLNMIPDHPLAGALGEALIQQSAAERGWSWNVHDHVAAIEAVAHLVAQQRRVPTDRIVARAADGRVLMNQSATAAGTAKLGEEFWHQSLQGLTRTMPNGSAQLSVNFRAEGANNSTRRATPFYFSLTVNEVPRTRPLTPDVAGFFVERWYERLSDATPIVQAREGELVRVRLRVTVPNDRQFVLLEDMLPAGLEVVDLSMRTSAELGPFLREETAASAARQRDVAVYGSLTQNVLYGGWGNGSWDGGWWSPWEHKESRDDRVLYFTRQLWSGTYNTSYVARATTVGTFVKPPARAAEMYNAAVQGRSDGGVFTVIPK